MPLLAISQKRPKSIGDRFSVIGEESFSTKCVNPPTLLKKRLNLQLHRASLVHISIDLIDAAESHVRALSTARPVSRIVCWHLQELATSRGITSNAHPEHSLATCNQDQNRSKLLPRFVSFATAKVQSSGHIATTMTVSK
jgi:hypothetical protein